MKAENVIYKITNSINDRVYIGSAVKFNIRVNQHSHHLKKGTHHNPPLQNHVDKYGFDSISFEIIEFCEHDNLIEREQYYIDNLNPYFNVRRVAENMKGTKRTEEQKKHMVSQRRKKSGYKKGWTHTKETREKISKANKGKVISEEQRKMISEKNKGNVVSKEAREKISKKLKGRTLSDEHRRNLSKTKNGDNNPMYGKVEEKHHNYGKKWKQKNISKNIKKVLNIETNEIYRSSGDAVEKTKVSRATILRHCNNQVKKPKFKYYE